MVAHGRIDLFEPQGALQLYVESIQPAGLGDLTLRFEALKARLAAEGLFETSRKRPLPPRPATIAVITSPTGAVWKDICHVISRRWPLTRVLLVAAQVQGESAPASLVGAFRKVERYAAAQIAAGRPDEAPAVTILARGGGSLEDLWAFNDEAVVRAVVAHSVPVVCGVGHEVDVTLSDFAADVRAPTPSAAAEVVVPDRAEFLAAVRGGGRRLDGAVATLLRTTGREVIAERRALDRLSPVAQLASARERVGLSLDRATRAITGDLATRRRRVRAARRPARADTPRARGTGPRRGSAGATSSTALRPGAWRSPAHRSDRPRRRWPSSARRRRSTVATRSSAGPTMAGSCATQPMPRPGRGWRCASPRASCRPPPTTDDRATESTERPQMDGLITLALFILIVVVVAVVGVRLGMLLAPRIDRLTEPHEEEPGGDDD